MFIVLRYLQSNPGKFNGVPLKDLPELEKLFEVNIVVYSLEPTRSEGEQGYETNGVDDNERPEIAAHLIQRSHHHYGSTLYLNLYKYHFSYIKSLARYSKSYQCSRCGKYWKHAGMMHRHERNCEAKTRLRFPGASYVTPPTLFDQLADEGIEVSEEFKYFEYFATYDFESMFNRERLPENTEKLTWENKHVPLSASICSNVPGYTSPKCFITNGNSPDLLKSFVDHLILISRESYRLLLSDFEGIFSAIDEKIGELVVDEGSMDEMAEILVDLQGESENGRGIDVMDSDMENEEEIESENDVDRVFINDERESEDQDSAFYRALNQELGDRLTEECREGTEKKEKPKEHPLVKLKVIIYVV